jgi:hypothetical protein
MSERGNFRGGGRGGGGGHRGGNRGGGSTPQERPKKENILDLAKYMDKQVTVKFNGGREGKNMSMTWQKNHADSCASDWHSERL